MRIDKYLKVSRLIKRRTLANEACENARVSLNGKIAKPGTVVSIGDELEIRFGNAIVKVLIKSIEEHVMKNEAREMYELL